MRAGIPARSSFLYVVELHNRHYLHSIGINNNIILIEVIIMVCNVGDTERMARILVGLLIIGIGFALSSWWGLIGIIPVFTGVSGWCPAYLPFNISTK